MVLWMKFLHVATAVLFISGLFGRTLTMWQASRSSDVQTLKMLVELAGMFERWMVIPGSLAVLGFGLVTAWLQGWAGSSAWLLVSTLLYLSLIPVIIVVFVPRGKVFERALAQAVAQGSITRDLRSAFHDRVVHLAHGYELAVTAVIMVLMVMKPF
jgi:uncharacterized membrane protein